MDAILQLLMIALSAACLKAVLLINEISAARFARLAAPGEYCRWLSAGHPAEPFSICLFAVASVCVVMMNVVYVVSCDRLSARAKYPSVVTAVKEKLGPKWAPLGPSLASIGVIWVSVNQISFQWFPAILVAFFLVFLNSTHLYLYSRSRALTKEEGAGSQRGQGTGE